MKEVNSKVQQSGCFCEEDLNLFRAGQVECNVSLVGVELRVCTHGDQVGHNSDVSPARGNVEWGTAGVRQTIDVCLASLQEELNAGERVVFRCKVESSLPTVEVLEKQK